MLSSKRSVRTSLINILNSKWNTLNISGCRHMTIQPNPPIFTSKENVAARETMQKFGKYNLWSLTCKPFASPAYNNTDDMVTKIIANFRIIAELTTTSSLPGDSKAFARIYDHLINASWKLSDSQLFEVLDALAQFKGDPMNRRIDALRKSLNKSCMFRCNMWSVSELLLACDIWYQIPYGFVHFMEVACESLTRQAHRLSAQQLIQTLFYVSCRRKQMKHMQLFEQPLSIHFDALTLDELAIAAMAFNRTNLNIQSSELVQQWYERVLMEDLRSVGDMTITPILKILRTSSKWYIHNHLNEALQKKLLWNAEHQSLLTALHISLLGTKLRVCNPDLLEIIAQRFAKNITTLRLKDMERFTMAMALFDFKSSTGADDSLADLFVNDLTRRTKEIADHPSSYTSCVYNLSLLGFDDVNLIASVLDPTYLQRNYGFLSRYQNEILFLDSYTRINLKDTYKNMPQLSNNSRHVLAKQCVEPLKRRRDGLEPVGSDKLIANIAESVRTVFNYFHIGHALPHFAKSDIYVIIDARNGMTANCSMSFPSSNDRGCFITKDLVTEYDDNLVGVAICLANSKQYYRIGENQYFTRLFKTKIKQLRLIGWQPVVIPYFEWHEMNQVARNLYVGDKVREIVENSRGS